jgi:hypothetical protein
MKRIALRGRELSWGDCLDIVLSLVVGAVGLWVLHNW